MLAEGTFAGKVALVTGGGSGLGRAFALEFGRLGADVVVAGRRLEPLDETVGLIEGRGGRALAQPTDVRDPEQVDAMSPDQAWFSQLVPSGTAWYWTSPTLMLQMS